MRATANFLNAAYRTAAHGCASAFTVMLGVAVVIGVSLVGSDTDMSE